MNPPDAPESAVINAPPLPAKRPPNWIDRNWKWAVPSGCLVSLFISIGFIVGFIALVFNFLKSSDVYQQTVQRVQNSPEVIAVIGSPVETNWFFTGSVSTKGASGTAEFAIPFSGPGGKATAYVEATKSLGLWHYDKLVVTIESSGQQLDLSVPQSPSSSTP